MKKSAVKTPPTEYGDILMKERMKLSSLEITPSKSKVIIWISFLQNTSILMHIIGFGKLGFFELYFAIFSPNIFFVFTEFAKVTIFALIVNTFLILLPLVYYLRLIIEKRQQRKFDPLRLYDLVVNKSELFGYFNYILIPLILLPYFEMNLFLNFCYGPGLTLDPNDDYSFHRINAAACTDPTITALRVITLISIVVIGLHLILLINYIFSKEQSDANHLSNNSRTADWLQVARKFSLGFFMLPELLHADVFQYSVITFTLVINIIQVGIDLTRFTYYNQQIAKLAATFSIAELFFTIYITINKILIRTGNMEEVDQIYLPLFLIISYISASAIVNKVVRSSMRPFIQNDNVAWYLKRLQTMYYFMKEASNGITLVPKLGQDSLEDQILSYFRSHFISCHSPSCICQRIKSKEDIHDLSFFKKIDYSEDLNSQDGVITVTAKLFYLKHFFWSRLKELQAVNSDNQQVLFAMLKYEVFEMKHFIRACELIRVIEKKELGNIDQYELKYLRMIVKHYYEFDFNHRIRQQPFYNLEKFIDIQNSVLEIESTIYISMRSFYKTLFYLVGLLGKRRAET